MSSSKIMGYNLDDSVLNGVAQEESVQTVITKLDEMGSSGGSSSGGVQEFTSSGTFTVPEGVTKIYVTACGGGGGGGGYHYYKSSNYKYYDCYSGGGGGGAAAIVRRPFIVTPGESIAITIGSGGSAGGSKTDGSKGGSTVIGSLITLPGGSGGVYGEGGQAITTHYGRKASSGGAGGGYGGAPGFCYTDNQTGKSENVYRNGTSGANGILGCGGAASGVIEVGSEDSVPYVSMPMPNGGAPAGGGGGSLGIGGYGADMSRAAGTPGYGGGGGGGYRGMSGTTTSYNASKGGAGYCLIEW